MFFYRETAIDQPSSQTIHERSNTINPEPTHSIWYLSPPSHFFNPREEAIRIFNFIIKTRLMECRGDLWNVLEEIEIKTLKLLSTLFVIRGIFLIRCVLYDRRFFSRLSKVLRRKRHFQSVCLKRDHRNFLSHTLKHRFLIPFSIKRLLMNPRTMRVVAKFHE